jgi:hypothetical protein
MRIACKTITRSVWCFLLSAGLLFWFSPRAWAQAPAPRWGQMNPEQRVFLLEAFNLGEAQKAGFADSIPNEVKQTLLDSMWNLLTPEKRVQVLLYAHLERPFGEASNETAKSPAPAWTSLSKFQKAKAFEAFHFDGNQRAFFESMPTELRQGAFETLWSYLNPASRKVILSK